MTALVLGILGVVCCGLLAPIAWYRGNQELQAIRAIVPSLAEALRVARGRYSRDNMMQQRLDEMAARLAQLEGGAPKPA